MRHPRFEFDPTRPILGTLASCEIVFDRQQSHNHLAELLSEDQATEVLESALAQIDAQDRDHFAEEVYCADTILYTQCVETSAEDRIVHAHRRGRNGPTRFVMDREPELTNHLVVVLLRDKDRPGVMILVSASTGRIAQREPWDENLTDEKELAASHDFWSKHALIWDPTTVDFTRRFWEEVSSA